MAEEEGRVLVVYASRCGSCAEIAEEVGRVISERWPAVDVAPVDRVKRLTGYSAVVLGTAIRMGKPLGEMQRFGRRNRRELGKVPVAVFSVGLAPKPGKAEGIVEADSFIEPFAETVHATTVAAFPGAVFPDRLPFPFNKAAENPEGGLAAGDYRDWNAVRSWATHTAGKLAQAAPSAV
jgi:menaquinone-dependent protoporphyrinogen oxidase